MKRNIKFIAIICLCYSCNNPSDKPINQGKDIPDQTASLNKIISCKNDSLLKLKIQLELVTTEAQNWKTKFEGLPTTCSKSTSKNGKNETFEYRGDIFDKTSILAGECSRAHRMGLENKNYKICTYDFDDTGIAKDLCAKLIIQKFKGVNVYFNNNEIYSFSSYSKKENKCQFSSIDKDKPTSSVDIITEIKIDELSPKFQNFLKKIGFSS